LCSCGASEHGDAQQSQTAESSNVGQPCTPDDESHRDFSGFRSEEVVLGEDTECPGPSLCLIDHFQGRVSCSEGQTAEQAASDPVCMAVDSGEPVSVAVEPQLATRPASAAVYCSHRCDGPNGAAGGSSCPAGFECAPLVEQLGTTPNEYAGSYCVKISQ
jgi:hypothetical protein